MNKPISQQIDEMLAKVDFEAIWPGFLPSDYILFIDGKAYLHGEEIPWDGRFMANTALDYNGRQVATWNVVYEDEDDTKLDAESNVSGIVHEMFHVFQNNNGETRHANEFALFMYPHDLDNYQLKQAENFYLAKAFAENSQLDLEQFVTIRKARSRIISADAMLQEMLSETKEGMAEYAGLMALNQLSRRKFVEAADRHLGRLRDPEILMKPRLVSYSVGCMMCLAMASIGIDFFHALDDPRPLFELIPQSVNAIQEQFDKQREELAERFDALRLSRTEYVERECEITGFDPMAMVRVGDEILCESNVMLDDEAVQGPLLLEMQAGSLNAVKAYSR